MHISLELLELILSRACFNFPKESKILVILFGKFKTRINYYLRLKQMNIAYIFTNTKNLNNTLYNVIIKKMRQNKYKGCILYAHKTSKSVGVNFTISRSKLVRDYMSSYDFGDLEMYYGFKFTHTELDLDNEIEKIYKYHKNCRYISSIGNYKSEGNFFIFLDKFNELCN